MNNEHIAMLVKFLYEERKEKKYFYNLFLKANKEIERLEDIVDRLESTTDQPEPIFFGDSDSSWKTVFTTITYACRDCGETVLLSWDGNNTDYQKLIDHKCK